MESEEIHENHPPQFRNIKPAHQIEAEQLPEEIIEEILARLPVKSLLKFRSVSKSWLSLIGSQKFIKTHLENSTKNTNFTYHRILLHFFPRQSILKHCSLHSLLNERFTDSFAFDDPMFNSGATFRVVGCCNGLVCILIDGKHFFLWNPSTRVSRKLPDLDHMGKYGRITKYGFGFVVDDDDYKVFAFLSVFLLTGRHLGKSKVYSLRTDSWKIVKDKDCCPFDEAGKFASGKLHWLRKFGFNYNSNIVSFDLKSNMYGTLELPRFEEGGHYSSLGVIGGCLCLLRDYRKTSLDVWVMKEYGVKESWHKVMTVPYLWDSISWECSFFNPLYISPNREILFVYESTSLMYYPRDDRFLPRQILNIGQLRGANVYVESLVSPFCHGEEEVNEDLIV